VINITDIAWQSDPLPHLEDQGVLLLDEAGLLEHVGGLRSEASWLRRLLHEALACVAKLSTQLRRATTIITDLQHENQRLRRER
jgi:hypothetical protein